MNYYEELAVAQDASLEEIRVAYRALARILHPDNQSDPKLKSTAERQMVRLNEMIEILADPEKRRRYDESLRPPSAVSEAMPPPESNSALRQQFPWVLACSVLVGVGLWYWRSNEAAEPVGDRGTGQSVLATHNQPTEGTLGGSDSLASGEDRVLPDKVRVPRRERPMVPDEKLSRQSLYGNSLERPKSLSPEKPDSTEMPIAGEPSRLAGPLDETAAAAPSLVGKPAGLAMHPAVIAPESPPPSQRPTEQSHGPTFAGRWLYALGDRDTHPPGMYPPEFIEFSLSEARGALSGRYWARYRIPDKPVSPEVQFRVSGTLRPGNAVSLIWTSDDGASGEMKVLLRDVNSMDVTWWTTAFGRQTALTSGTAVLVRQQTR